MRRMPFRVKSMRLLPFLFLLAISPSRVLIADESPPMFDEQGLAEEY
jgi:hypothetical protein